MRTAQIDSNGVCVVMSSIIVGEPPSTLPASIVLVADDEYYLGWRWDGSGWVDPPAAPEPEEIIADISDRQFFQALAQQGDITEVEALDAVGPGIIPPAMDALIDQLPAEQRFPARMLIRGATRYERRHPIADLIRGLYGWTEEQADDFWRFAATL